MEEKIFVTKVKLPENWGINKMYFRNDYDREEEHFNVSVSESLIDACETTVGVKNNTPFLSEFLESMAEDYYFQVEKPIQVSPALQPKQASQSKPTPQPRPVPQPKPVPQSVLQPESQPVPAPTPVLEPVAPIVAPVEPAPKSQPEPQKVESVSQESPK